MLYSIVNFLELQIFRNVYSEENVLMAASDKIICEKYFDLLVFPRNLLKFGFNKIVGIPKYLHSKFKTPFAKSCCYMETT